MDLQEILKDTIIDYTLPVTVSFTTKKPLTREETLQLQFAVAKIFPCCPSQCVVVNEKIWQPRNH